MDRKALYSSIPTMEVKTRSNGGCWTCRCRRKKCDERAQPCETCESLRLPCHGYGERPGWMDGDIQEKAQALAFKALVKHQTTLKRRSKARSRSSLPPVGELIQSVPAIHNVAETDILHAVSLIKEKRTEMPRHARKQMPSHKPRLPPFTKSTLRYQQTIPP
jgi:hypothetical protein